MNDGAGAELATPEAWNTKERGLKFEIGSYPLRVLCVSA